MKVLLSGSGGLIGRALTEQLEGEGHQVVPLVRPAGAPGKAAEATVSPMSAAVPWDPARGTIDRSALDRHGPFKAVVHLAGAGIGDARWTARRREEILESRVRSTQLLAGTVVALRPVPDVMVSASAVGYYGDRGDEVLTEESGPGLGFLAQVCRAWEEAAIAAEARLRVVRLRTGIVLSRRGGALAKQLPLFRLGLGARLGDGKQYTSWITLDDHVSVIRRAIDDARLTGPVNATAPAPVTNGEFTRALGRAVHRPAVLAVPRPALSLALGGEMARELLLGGQRVLPARLDALGHSFAYTDLDSALTHLIGS